MADDHPRGMILLVDDRPENLLALGAILGSLGQELVSVRSGEEALKRLLTDEFAVILLDVQMPGMDGFETAQRIKQRDRTRDTPIIFLTAIDREPQQVFRGYAAGAVDYLSKPFDPWLLRAKVTVFVELFEKNQRLAELAREQSRGHHLLAEVAQRLSDLEERLVSTQPGREADTLARARGEVQTLLRHVAPFASDAASPPARRIRDHAQV